MNTFKDLYEYLRSHDIDREWLSDNWEGKDKQESLLRIFTRLGLMSCMNEYQSCIGNFNLMSITKQETYHDVFHTKKGNLIKLKDSGDSSDLTCVDIHNGKHLIAFTSKNMSHMTVGKLEIDKILTNFSKYEKNGYRLSIGVCVRSRGDYIKMKKAIHETSRDLYEILNRKDTIVIDWDDLLVAHHRFVETFKDVDWDDLIALEKRPILFKPHQELCVTKTLELKQKQRQREILWGHVQRSGKSYMIAGVIIKDSVTKSKCDYLIITTAPNETIDNYAKVMNCAQLDDFNVVLLDGKNKKPKLKKKNIIICSKQFLQTKIERKANGKSKTKHASAQEKTKNIAWLKNLDIDIRFIDESHNGGTTELAKKTLEYYGREAFTIQITATYTKPANDFDIPRSNWILWDLEDIHMCQNIAQAKYRDRMIQKHGKMFDDIFKLYPDRIISETYSTYPLLHILTDKITENTIQEVKLCDTQLGYSVEACMLLKQHTKTIDGKKKVIKESVFQNEKEALKLWQRIFGDYQNTKMKIPSKECEEHPCFMERIKHICNHHESPTQLANPLVIMAFLPPNNVEKLTAATVHLLEKNNVVDEYLIIGINSKKTNNPKQDIENAVIKAKHADKRGVLVLSGRQCSLGVTIQNCDIVLLLNNSQSFDMIYQMMFRSMTERNGKTCGFVIDMNLKRAINTTLVDYACLINGDQHPKDAIHYLLKERLISLNADQWEPSMGFKASRLEEICQRIYEIYAIDTECALRHFLDRLKFKQVLLTGNEQKIFNALFVRKKLTKKDKELLNGEVGKNDSEIGDGIEKIKIEDDDPYSDDESSDYSDLECDGGNENEGSEPKEKENPKVNYMELLKHVIPLVCLLTIHEEESSLIGMMKEIEKDDTIKGIMLNQIQTWWGESIDDKALKEFIYIYIKYVKDDKETSQIIRIVKELFQKNVENSQELSILIDKYLIPEEIERKKNAEISTPRKLRQEMLDKMPLSFWETEGKVFEPCCGKGGFLIDVADKFMAGLKKKIPDPKKRYKTIVEKCLYFSDINPTNIFISKLLLDPYGEYELNYNEGDTLKLNIKKRWGFERFDLVVGNPPYSTDPSKQNAKPIYNLFIERLIDECRMLLFVTPSRWFSCGKGLDKFRKAMLKRRDLVLIEHANDAHEWFGNLVSIRGGVSYFLKDSEHEDDCKFNGMEYCLGKYDCVIDPKNHPLIDKVIGCKNKLSDIYQPSGYFGVRTNGKELTKKGKILCYVSTFKSKDRKMYLKDYEYKKNMKSWKVITPRASGHEYDGFGVMLLCNPDSIYTDSYIGFKVKSEQEGKYLISYLKTKIVNELLSFRKMSQDISENTIKFIPLVPLDRVWNDNSVKKYFELSL